MLRCQKEIILQENALELHPQLNTESDQFRTLFVADTSANDLLPLQTRSPLDYEGNPSSGGCTKHVVRG